MTPPKLVWDFSKSILALKIFIPRKRKRLNLSREEHECIPCYILIKRHAAVSFGHSLFWLSFHYICYSLFWINIFLCGMLCSVWEVRLKPNNLISCGPSTNHNNNFLRYLHSFPCVLFCPSHISSVYQWQRKCWQIGKSVILHSRLFSPCISVIPSTICTSVSNPCYVAESHCAGAAVGTSYSKWPRLAILFL